MRVQQLRHPLWVAAVWLYNSLPVGLALEILNGNCTRNTHHFRVAGAMGRTWVLRIPTTCLNGCKRVGLSIFVFAIFLYLA